MKNTIRKTTTAITVIAIIVGTANFALAANYSTNDTKNERSSMQQNPMQTMLNGLDLSEDQSTQITAILENSRPDQNSQQRPSREEHNAIMEQIKAVLTDTQIAQFEESQSNMGGNKRQGPGQR